jgi:hypothetical protein
MLLFSGGTTSLNCTFAIPLLYNFVQIKFRSGVEKINLTPSPKRRRGEE